MKLSYLILPLLVLSISCSREADVIQADKNIINPPAFESLEFSKDDIDTNIRAVTLIAYPNPEELTSVDLTLSDREFDDVFRAKTYDVVLRENSAESISEENLVPYADVMPNGVGKGLNELEKARDVIIQVINVGNVRDEAIRDYARLKKQIQPTLDTISQIDLDIQENTFYEITNKKGEFKPFRRDFVLSPFKEYGLKTKVKVTRNCKTYAKRYKKLARDLEFTETEVIPGEVIIDPATGEPQIDPTTGEVMREPDTVNTTIIPAISAHELVFLDELKERCDEIPFEQVESMQDKYMAKRLLNSSGKIELESTYNAGKTYVTNLLDGITLQNNKTYLSTGVYKESDLDGSAGESFPKRKAVIKQVKANGKVKYKSKDLLKFSEIDMEINSIGEFKKFKLHLELLGSEPKVYSLENGGITDFKYDEYLGAKRLLFSINGKDSRGINVKINAELGESASSVLGVRFVGDVEFIYENGERNEGVMKIELDLKESEVMPIDKEEGFVGWCDEVTEQVMLKACNK